MGTRSVRTEHVPVSMHVPFAAASVAVARRELKTWMGDRGGSMDQIEDARVVVSELVGNAVRHARPLADGTLEISWAATGRGVQLSVTDGGSATRPRKLNAPSSALAGRGMAIVDSLALKWWAEQTRTGSTVHAVLPMA